LDIIVIVLNPSPFSRGRGNSYALSPWEKVGVRARKNQKPVGLQYKLAFSAIQNYIKELTR